MNILNLFLSRRKYKKSSFSCNSKEYYDDILLLKSPKVLKSAISSNHFSISIDDIINNDNTKVLVSGKFDKKSNLPILVDDKNLMKIKKSKNKINKNKHRVEGYDVSKIPRSDEEIFDNKISIKRKKE